MQDYNPNGSYPPPAPNGAPGYQNPNYQNPGYQNQGYQNPGYQNPGYQNPGYQNPGYQNPGYQNQGYQNPGYQNPGYQNQTYQNYGYQNPGYVQRLPGQSEADACKLWGILSLVFYFVPVVPFLLPLICVIISGSKRKAYYRLGGTMFESDVKTGKTCSTITTVLLVLSVVATVVFTVLFLVLGVNVFEYIMEESGVDLGTFFYNW